jgi:hypothetical protein
LSALAVSLARALLIASDGPALTEEQIRQFLLTAEVVASQRTTKGRTAPQRLTLTDGKLTHDAAFQTIDERKRLVRTPDRRVELFFRDSYQFNIAAYELAKLVGLGDMVPVTVERQVKGRRGALCWWVRAMMDEADRQKQKIPPPDVDEWYAQMNKVWVFSQLIYDTDRNQTNILITEDWKLVMIDFTRAFRPFEDLEDPTKLLMCDRQLLSRLRELDEREVLEKTRPHLSKELVRAVMARRDRIVEHFEKLIRERGDDAVLYGDQPAGALAAQ